VSPIRTLALVMVRVIGDVDVGDAPAVSHDTATDVT
jgi:hypothetical protein